MTELELKKRMCYAKKAITYLGIKTGSDEHKRMVDYWNGLIPIPDNHILTYDSNWCCLFVTYVADMLGWSHVFPRTWSCETLLKTADTYTPWESKDFNPKIGDIILYDWGEVKGPQHSGIVTSSDIYGSLYVIEGDYKHSVAIREINKNNKLIMGTVTLPWRKFPYEIDYWPTDFSCN